MNQIWYNSEASDFNQAVPVGNGRLGAMVYGRIQHEVISLNEESVWSAPYKNRNNKSCPAYLDEIRSLLKSSRVEEAQALALQSMAGTPVDESMYQTAGQLHIDFYTDLVRGIRGPVTDKDNPFPNSYEYRRSLDLTTATATTTFSTQNIIPSNADFARYQRGSAVTYTREVFASAVSDVLVVHLTASTPKSIYFRACIERYGGISSVTNLNEEDTLAVTCTQGIPFAIVVHAAVSGGKVTSRGEYIDVEGADEATLYIDIETAYRNRHYRSRGGNVARMASSYCYECMDKALRKVCLASGQSFSDFRKQHLIEWESRYNNIHLDLSSALSEGDRQRARNMATDSLLHSRDLKPALAELYWNYGRYLLLSSSRQPGKLPANLQGLWNESMTPSWGSRFTVNINTQMNYWGACMNGLADTEKNLFYLIKNAYKKGVVTSRQMYGCRGWVCHHNTDIWGDTAPQDKWLPGSFWVLGAAWLCTHIWEHYTYTLDKKFLKKHYYLLEDACQFFVDYMVKDLEGKYYIVSPSVSPENTYILPNGQRASLSEGSDMDNRILGHLFESTLRAAGILGKKSGLLQKISQIQSQIQPPVVTKDGTIREWPVECSEAEPGHRHMSHLYGLFPGHEIRYYNQKELCAAAESTINKRLAAGGGHTGWSQAWIMNFWATLHNRDNAWKSLENLFDHSTLDNLLDNHPPFQIDGNFGAMTAITRFVVQSDMVSEEAVDVDILPCLPSELKKGSLTGVCLKGNLKMDLAWDDGELTVGKIYSEPGTICASNLILHYQDKTYEAPLYDGKLDVFNVITNL